MTTPSDRLPIEPVEIIRVPNILSDKGGKVTAAGAVILDLAKLRNLAGAVNAHEFVLDALSEQLVKAQYRSPLVFWGWHVHHPYVVGTVAWELAVTPCRQTSAKLSRLCGTLTEAMIDGRPSTGYLSDAAEPILKWAPGTGLIRLWGLDPHAPNLSRLGEAVYERVPKDSLRAACAKMYGGQMVSVQHREYEIHGTSKW